MTPPATNQRAIDPVAEFSIRVDPGEARRASEWLGEAGLARGIPADPMWRLDLCVAEALANVIAHGGPGAAAGSISLRLDVRCGAAGGGASVTVSDTGVAFDPRTVPPKPRPRTLAEAEPGGQGIPLLRQFADALDYSYSDGRNHLTIHVRWDPDPGASP